jgi:plasmid stabilization system protein ParE
MAGVEVRWTLRARRDVRAIREYIAAQGSPVYGQHVARRLFDRADLLAAHPAAGRRVPEYDHPDIRELSEPPHRIIYRYVEGASTVEVLTVVHGRQPLPERAAIGGTDA